MNIPIDILKGWRVVVVDDEEDSLNIASYLLDFYGAEVHTAQNGAEGLALVRSLHPRFVVSDLSMPVMDGWGLIEEIQHDPATRDIPVIALTAHAMLGDREKAMSVGFHNYLTKPLTPATFMGDLLRLLINIPDLARDLPTHP